MAQASGEKQDDESDLVGSGGLCGGLCLGVAGQPEPAETITPSQAEAMIARFISSPDGTRLGLRKVDDPERLSGIYGPYVDPRDGRIRCADGGWIRSREPFCGRR